MDAASEMPLGLSEELNVKFDGGSVGFSVEHGETAFEAGQMCVCVCVLQTAVSECLKRGEIGC